MRFRTTHIPPHNIATPQDTVATAALASECEANGDPFPIHKLATPPTVKKEPASDITLIQRTFAVSSHRIDTQPYHQMKRKTTKRIAADCLPYNTMEMRAFKAMTRSLDLKCPDFGRKAITSQMGHCPKYCSTFLAFLNMFFFHY